MFILLNFLQFHASLFIKCFNISDGYILTQLLKYIVSEKYK